MKSFEKWYPGEDVFKGRDVSAIAERAWNAAREGMIPEDEAIRVPNVKRWPAIAVSCQLAFRCVHGNGVQSIVWAGDTQEISRPVPKWEPNKDDVVFFQGEKKNGVGHVLVMKISDVLRSGRVEFVGLPNLAWPDSMVKPFDLSKVGLPWGEI